MLLVGSRIKSGSEFQAIGPAPAVSAANQHEVGRCDVTLDCAHDLLSDDATGSTSSFQFMRCGRGLNTGSSPSLSLLFSVSVSFLGRPTRQPDPKAGQWVKWLLIIGRIVLELGVMD